MNWVWKCHFWDPVFNSFGFTARSVITGSWGGSIFNFWGNLYHFPKQLHYFVFLLIMQKVPISPHSCPNWLFAPTPFFDHGGPYLIGLMCFSVRISDVDHLFMCLWAICLSSLEKHLFKSVAYCFFFFFNQVVWFCCWGVGVSINSGYYPT